MPDDPKRTASSMCATGSSFCLYAVPRGRTALGCIIDSLPEVFLFLVFVLAKPAPYAGVMATFAFAWLNLTSGEECGHVGLHPLSLGNYIFILFHFCHYIKYKSYFRFTFAWQEDYFFRIFLPLMMFTPFLALFILIPWRL